MVKIAIIGAGSVVFTKNLLNDILKFDSLKNEEIWLMDIDEDRLNTAYILAKALVEKNNAQARIFRTLNMKEAVKDAKFIINTIQVGGIEDTITDFDIPEKYGVKQTIADTHGIAAVFRALRTIPEVIEIAHVVEMYSAKDSIILNYSNPMAMVTWAIYDLTSVNVVGLCHSIQGSARQLASYMGIDYSSLRYRAGGINHINWFLELETNGKNAYPMLHEAIKDNNIYSCDKVRFELMKMFGYFVSESSEHLSEYVPYFMKEDKKIEELDIPIREYVRRCHENNDVYDLYKKVATGEFTLDQLNDAERNFRFHKKGEVKSIDEDMSVEYASRIMNSVITGEHITIHGNVKNTGLIPNLPEGCCVEVPVLVNRNGLQPTYFGELPPQLAGIIRWHVSVQDLAVRAFKEKRRDYIYHAALLDPLVNSLLKVDDIYRMTDDFFDAYSKLMKDYR